MTALKPPRASTLLIVLAGAAGVEICYLTATRTRRVSAAAAATIGVGLLIPLPGGDRLALLRGGTGGPGVALVTLIAWLIGNSVRQAQRNQQRSRDPLPSPRRSRHATHHEHDPDQAKG
jgi:hypothetical protein